MPQSAGKSSAVLRSMVLILLCVAILLAGYHPAKKLCIKDRSFLCVAFSFVVSPKVRAIPYGGASPSIGIIPEIVFPESQAASVFHPPRSPLISSVA